ncbi:MAG TPA: CDP-glucose 4,6-dehydratase [Dongiaceae bacterium]|nr:CDP-glucose 4,6-dehydratase [Dongiaceae bacterium]
MPQRPLPNGDFWQGRKVLVTGHTGFVGGWLSLWLHHLGARVSGYALPSPTEPSFCDTVKLPELIDHAIGDVRSLADIQHAVAAAQPQITFHLAAQPLVRLAHREPVETFSTNVMGTVHLLEALRHAEDLETAVVFTTDKVYRNVGSIWPYRETDTLGGEEPYGASKVCAEWVTAAYRRSYFMSPTAKKYVAPPAIVAMRAGNIIGGGDWALDRLVPDAVRAFAGSKPLVIRHPEAIRPWQHVLEAVRGLLILAERSAADRRLGDIEGWNFGPPERDSRPVADLANLMVRHWGGSASWQDGGDGSVPEATTLLLASQKAQRHLAWQTHWSLGQNVEATIAWYKAHLAGEDMRRFSLRQIDDYSEQILSHLPMGDIA